MDLGPKAWNAEGPILAEVFPVWLHDETIELAAACGPAPCLLHVSPEEHPVEVVDRAVRDVLGEPVLIHSTSWRRDRDAVVLTFVVVIRSDQVADLQGVPVARAELARSDATAPPRTIDHCQVLEHGLRHLAWLAADDAVVAGVLPDGWRRALSKYAPEPFRALG